MGTPSCIFKGVIAEVDAYLQDGCGRCAYYATPDCKVNTWRQVLVALRAVLLETPLQEELKWSCPCYTHKGANVLMLSAFKDSAVVSFFKGALLKDPAGVLEKPGESSQAARFMRFTAMEQVAEREALLRAYVDEAIQLEEAGKKVAFKQNPEPMPEELAAILEADPELKRAFEALTPGRQRGYILYISGAKQASTRTARAEKHMERIRAGKGIHDR